jgi:hypothetical protein
MSKHSTPPKGPKDKNPRDAGFWAIGRNVLRVSDVPEGAVNLNVEGRRVIGALQGFGQLWQKTYTVRLTGVDVTPEEVVALWKREFPVFHPPESRFYPSLDGVAPGEIMLINASVQGMPVYTGVMVLYSDDVSFTVMTAEGLPEAGWNTFSAYEEDGATVVQIQSLARGATRSTRSASACSAQRRRRRSGPTSSPRWRRVSGCMNAYTWRKPAWTRNYSGIGSETSGKTRASGRSCTPWWPRPASWADCSGTGARIGA